MDSFLLAASSRAQAVSDAPRREAWREFNRRVRSTTPDFTKPLLAIPLPQSAPVPSHAWASLQSEYALSDAQVSEFRARRCIRLRGVLPPSLLECARQRLVALAARATAGRNPSLPASPPPESEGSASANRARWEALSEPTTRSCASAC